MRENMYRCCKLVTGIHTERQLEEFLAKEQSIREPLDFVQWRYFLIEDFKEDESVFIFKCHHSLTDGIGLALAMHGQTDNSDEAELPKVLMKTPFLKKLAIHLAMPLLILYYSVDNHFTPDENNGMTKRVNG